MKLRQPKYGDKRIRWGFLLFPIFIGEEGKWLEFATWEEMYGAWYGGDYVQNWYPIRWIEESNTK